MIYQTCNLCEEEKEQNTDNFYVDLGCKRGFRRECKKCLQEKGRKRNRDKHDQ